MDPGEGSASSGTAGSTLRSTTAAWNSLRKVSLIAVCTGVVMSALPVRVHGKYVTRSELEDGSVAESHIQLRVCVLHADVE